MTDTVYRLMTRHQRLDERLRAEQAYLLPDPHRLAELKKLKLAIKDRLARVSISGKLVSA